MQFLVGVEEQEIRSLQLEGRAVEVEPVHPALRQVVADGNFLQAYEVAAGDPFRRIVVCVVRIAQLAVVLVLDPGGNDRDGRDIFVARNRPAVIELLRHSHEVGIGLLEDGIQADHVAKGTGDKHIQAQPLIREGVAQGCHVRGVGGALELQILQHRRVRRLEIDAGRGHLPVLVQDGGKAFVVQAPEGNGEDGMVRISLHGETGAGHQVDDPAGGKQFRDEIV